MFTFVSILTKMITLEEIKELESRAKTGADFPRLIKELKANGLLSFEFLLENGVVVYSFLNEQQLKTEAQYELLKIKDKSDSEYFIKILKEHQRGNTNFPEFCQQAADSGVCKWVVDTNKMTCTYFDLGSNELYSEPIPSL